MSHSSGIPVSQNLRDSFGEAITSSDNRFIKVQIDNEELVSVTTVRSKGDYLQDLSMLPDHFDKERPCYIIFRLDTSNPQFALFCYVPDKAKVKEKMLYASTRYNLKQQLGMNFFVDEVFGTVLNDFSAEGYKHHMLSKKSEAPLTESEQTKKHELESGPIYSGGQTTYVHGVAFPVEKKSNGCHNRITQWQRKLCSNCD